MARWSDSPAVTMAQTVFEKVSLKFLPVTSPFAHSKFLPVTSPFAHSKNLVWDATTGTFKMWLVMGKKTVVLGISHSV